MAFALARRKPVSLLVGFDKFSTNRLRNLVIAPFGMSSGFHKTMLGW